MLNLLRTFHTVFWGIIRSLLLLFPIIGFIHFGIIQALGLLYDHFGQTLPGWFNGVGWILLAGFLVYILIKLTTDFVSGRLLKEYIDAAGNTHIFPVTALSFPEINAICQDVVDAMDIENVYFFITEEGPINAFALSSLNQNVVVIHSDLISKLKNYSGDDSTFRAVVAHELSHIKHRDSWVSTIYELLLQHSSTLGRGFSDSIEEGAEEVLSTNPLLDLFGRIFQLIIKVMVGIAKITYMFITPVEYLVSRFLDRKVEFRADADAAALCGKKAVSDYCMFFIHELGDEKAHVFSTHPTLIRRLFRTETSKQHKPHTRSTSVVALFVPMIFFSITFGIIITVSIEKALEAFLSIQPDFLSGSFDSVVYNLVYNSIFTVIFQAVIYWAQFIIQAFSNGFRAVQSFIGLNLSDFFHYAFIYIVLLVGAIVGVIKLKALCSTIWDSLWFSVKANQLSKKPGEGNSFDILLLIAVKYRNLEFAVTSLENGCSPSTVHTYDGFTGSAVEYAEVHLKRASFTIDKTLLTKMLTLYRRCSRSDNSLTDNNS